VLIPSGLAGQVKAFDQVAFKSPIGKVMGPVVTE
jgi:hypothetical protein